MSLTWYDPFRSSRLLGPSYPDVEEYFSRLVPREFYPWTNTPWSSALSKLESGAQVTWDKDQFRVNVDVQQFRPEEIAVKVAENTITVEGKHEERRDEHGYISRQFVRKYVLPEGHDAGKVESHLSSDGVLSITAPKISDPKAKERQIPIAHTGQPSKPIDDNKGK